MDKKDKVLDSVFLLVFIFILAFTIGSCLALALVVSKTVLLFK